MNSKIKQFAELSKVYKTILVDGQMQSVLLIDPEKFTQMIVQECIDINREELSFVAFNVLLDRYQEHFGIKE
jgi:hypothetical protein